MAISPDTFNALKRFVSVRLQQGVPLVDADWNEMEDIRKFELRAFLKWFVGDGIPEGVDDSFKIVVDNGGMVNDFRILAGGGKDGLKAGRCLVDGLDVFITEDTTFQTQPAIIENLTVRVPSLPPLTIPPIPGARGSKVETLVYLDVWERLITPDEDESLKHDSVRKVESCARNKREWAVRVRIDKDKDLPKPRDADYRSDHSYYKLALINIVSLGDGVGRFDAKTVIDLREKKLLIPPATLIEDTLGIKPTDYRRGKGRPKIDLREAINALLRGTLPSSPEQPISTEGSDYANISAVETRNGDIWAFWLSKENGIGNIWYGQHIKGNPVSDWEVEKQLTSYISNRDLGVKFLFTLTDDNNNLWVFWSNATTRGDEAIYYNRYFQGQQVPAWEGEKLLISYDEFFEKEVKSLFALTDKNGDVWIFWSVNEGREKKDEIYYNRYRYNHGGNLGDWEIDSNHLNPLVVENQPRGKEVRNPFAVEDGAGNILIFWSFKAMGPDGPVYYIWYRKHMRGSPLHDWEEKKQLKKEASLNSSHFFPVAIKDREGDVWVFWNRKDQKICYKRYVHSQAIISWEDENEVIVDWPSNLDPWLDFKALITESGDIWVLRSFDNNSVPARSFYARYGEDQGWNRRVERLDSNTERGMSSHADILEDQHGFIWAFWVSVSDKNHTKVQVKCKTITSQI